MKKWISFYFYFGLASFFIYYIAMVIRYSIKENELVLNIFREDLLKHTILILIVLTIGTIYNSIAIRK
jgi:hypothetical protein